MPCILKITDPLLKSILGKGEFNSINEIREVFEDAANRHVVLPMTIKAADKDFTFRKFGKIYKEDGIKVQIVMPGQEFFNKFELNLPENLSSLENYGSHDNKVLTFSSIDTFISFYLANYLYVTDSNYNSIVKSVTDVLNNTASRLKGGAYKHAGAIEDLKFAESLASYAKLLYDYAGMKQPESLNEVYELIQDKWNRYHKDKADQDRIQTQAKKNITELFKPVPPQVPANLFFQAFDYVNGKENTKPLATARRNYIKAITDPTKVFVKLQKGSVHFAQQTDDNGNYPSVDMIEKGVVGILVDEKGNQLYLNKNNELTTDRASAITIDYEVEGNKMSSPDITLLFLNRHKELKEQFLKSDNRDSFIFKIENTKFQVEEKRYQNFKEAGFEIDDIQINIIKDDPFAGFTYVTKEGKQIIVDSTPLNEDEIQDVTELLDHTYDEDELLNVVAYLNDLLSVGNDRVTKEKTGREIAFYADQSTGKILIHPFRIKTDEGYRDTESEPIYYQENPELVKQSLRAARIRFRKGEGDSLKTSWDKYTIEDGEVKKKRVKDSDGEKFYEDHIKDIKVEEIRSSQIATFTEKVIPLKDSPKKQFLGSLEIKPKTYTLGEIQQLAFYPLSNPEVGETESRIKQKELAVQIWQQVYSLSNAKFKFENFKGAFEKSIGVYTHDDKTIRLSPANLKTASNFRILEVLLEEVLHNVTMSKMDSYKDTEEFKRLEEDYERAKELLNTYQQTEKYQALSEEQKQQVDKFAKYHTQNIEEFIVGISNSHFRWFLKLGESRGENLLERVVKVVKDFLNKILKGEVPSLYTDVTTDLFDFISKKELTPLVIEQTQISVAPELDEPKQPKPKIERRKVEVNKKFFSAPEQGEIDIKIIEGLDAEIGKTLFSMGMFSDFVQGNVSTEGVWNRYYNDLADEYEAGVSEERERWIVNFFENEDYYKGEWMDKSKLFKFNNERIVINEEDLDLDEVDESENPEEEQGKDVGYNKIDSEQKYTRLQLADPYAKIFIRLIPKGTYNGLLQPTDFTNLWNRLQNKLANTLSYDEQIEILEKNRDLIPEASVIIDRLNSIPNDVNGAIIINAFQKSFSTAQVPVYNTYFTKTDNGTDYAFFQSARLDIQNLEMTINQGFRDFAEEMATTVRLGDKEIPTVDLKKLLDFLTKSKDLVATYRQLGFPIPEVNADKFSREASLNNFHSGFINLLKQRIGKWNGGESKNVIISNGDLISFLRSGGNWEEFGNLGMSPGIPVFLNKFISALSQYSPITVSNMTKNAENQNQSILLSWSSWLINLKKLNDGESYREKNPIFKYSLILRSLDSNNQVIPINLSGQRVQDGNGWEGTVSMDEDFMDYVRQQVTNMMVSGTAEILRAETKQTSLGYLFNWDQGKHPIKLDKFKTNMWQSDVLDVYGGYLVGELERIQLEKTNPVIYYPKYEKIKEQFHLFNFLSPELQADLLKTSPEQAVKEHKVRIKQELVNHFNNRVDRFKQKVFEQTGIKLSQSHPILNPIQVQSLIKEMGLDNFLRAFVTNMDIYQIEHVITGHGEFGLFDKFYKRSGSNVSTGTPVVINSKTQDVLENTIDHQFTDRIPDGRTFVIKDDIYDYPNEKLTKDIETSLEISRKAFGLDDKGIKEEAKNKSKKYKETNVADGQGFMTPDMGRAIMIATGTWTHDREKGFWFQKIQWKKNQGMTLTEDEQDHYDKMNREIKERGIFWFYPVLKMQYRGEFITDKNIAIEGLDKFSLAWLWPDVVKGTTFEPILNKMMDEGYDYGKFESGTKIGTFKPDDLLNQIRRGEVMAIESGHNIDLTYMKEQVRAGDKFKDMMPMSTQARKLVLSNLRFNGKYLNETIGEAATQWKKAQGQISEQNIKDLLDKISTDGQLDNRKLADEVQKEIKKRELPQSLTSIFTLYGQPDYQRFEQSLSPQLVETLIYSLLKNKVVRPKFPGEHYIQVASPLFERGRDLKFYELKDGKTQPAECKIVLSGEFVKLLNIKELNDLAQRKSTYKEMSAYEQLEWRRQKLNELLLNPEFVEKYRRELTVFSSRIPGQGYNSMDIQIVKEFLPTYLGPIIVPNPLATVKSGTDFDFDKLPTITPELNKEGRLTKGKVNQMLEAVSNLILDPINFHRLVTPNTTELIDGVISNTLDALGEKEKGKKMVEPTNNTILDFVTHLNKWWATKMKDALGIGATNNTFYTLLQEADAKLNPTFELTEELTISVKFPFNREDKDMSYPLLQDGTDKLEFVNEFINITVDVASNDAIGYTGLKRDNSALLLFLLENGVSFEDAFYFINQPIIFKYHQTLSNLTDQEYTLSEARNQAIENLLGIQVEVNGKKVPREEIYRQVNNKIKKDKFTNLLSTIATKAEINESWNTPTQKEYLAYYLIGLEMANKMRDAQSYNNFDTRPSPNVLYSESREKLIDQIKQTGLFDINSIQKIHNDSVVSHLNVHEIFSQINQNAFKIKRHPLFVKEALELGSFIYNPNDKENFFKKFDNDYLLAILQNYGTISKERVEENLKGRLAKDWKQIKSKIKDLTISKYIVENHSTKSPYVSLTLFLGLDNDSQTLDQIANDLRQMLSSEDKQVKQFAKDFIETGLYTTGFNQSPVYYLKALPFEVVNGYLKEAYDNYQTNPNFIREFSRRFRYQRGMAFSQYFLSIYKEEGIDNLKGKEKQKYFNQEPWRYTDYKLSLENQPDITNMNQPVTFQEHSSPNYPDRTRINAQADATIALAIDFETKGEQLTHESVLKNKKMYIGQPLPKDISVMKPIVDEVVKFAVDKLNEVNATSLNIAGNGIYTLVKKGYTQEILDDLVYEYLSKIVNSSDLKNPITSIRTGGQTGVDEAGAKAGIRLRIPTIILAPKGWKFRDESGTDISNEQKFKERFPIQQPKQLDLFEEQKDCDLDIPF